MRTLFLRSVVMLLGCMSMIARGADAPQQSPPPGASVGSDYIIGPGDALTVFVFGSPELSVSVPVRPDGKITTPLVEDMQAAGKTASKLARDMEEVLRAYLRTPQVNVIVTGATSVVRQVKVLGQVMSPQSIQFREGMTVLDAVIAAGGLTQTASGNKARLVRTKDGKTTETRIRIQDMLRKGRLETNFPLVPGDVIIVPESFL